MRKKERKKLKEEKAKEKEDKKIRKAHRHVQKKKKRKIIINRKQLLFSFIASIVLSLLLFLVTRERNTLLISLPVIFVLLVIYTVMRKKLKELNRIKKMESAFPDFLQLMATNLRAGITTDKALLMSARKEFAPLDEEIIKLGKNIVTGKKIDQALGEMSERIKSEKLQKTISLIISGIKTGGNLATLLEETSRNMKEREFVEKKASSNVLMYVIFIFFAGAVGAPALFGLSSVLVEVLTNIFSTVPQIENTRVNLPFTLTSISVSATFINYFSFIFLVAIDILASLVIGIVSKGEEKEGVKFVVPLIAISVTVFFMTRVLLLNYFSGFFG